MERVEATTRELELLDAPELPEYEDEAVVTEARGVGSSYELLVAYDRVLGGLDRVMQYHFELLGLGYWAYLIFYERCRQAFPDITDQTIAKMISAIDLLVLRPDEELKRLAQLAVELGVAGAVEEAEDEDALRIALSRRAEGARWLGEFDETKSPWFCFSNGNGLYHHHRSWIDDTRLPIAAIGSYVRRLEAGEDISRPKAAVLAERERITDEHRSLLTDETRQPFEESLALARTVYPFIEDHNFYIEHQYFSLLWNTIREFGALLAKERFLADQEDVFYLRHEEVREALEELRVCWSSGGAGVARGPRYWPPIVARRKTIYEAMCEWAPPPALGQVPETITRPGHDHAVGDHRRAHPRVGVGRGHGRRPSTLTGLAGSSGVAEGRARVILRADQLGELQTGRDPRRAVDVAELDTGLRKDRRGRARFRRHACATRPSSPASTASRPWSGPGRERSGSRPATGCASTATPASSRSSTEPANMPPTPGAYPASQSRMAPHGRDRDHRTSRKSSTAIEGFLARVADGPAALVLSGEAGIGKTILWEAGRRGGRATVRPRPDLSRNRGGGVVRLRRTVRAARPRRSRRSRPHSLAPRRRALEVALLLVEPGDAAPDAHAIGLAVLDALRSSRRARAGSRRARRRPVARSGVRRASLQIALRRLRDEPVGLLATVRLGPDLAKPVRARTLVSRRQRLDALS